MCVWGARETQLQRALYGSFAYEDWVPKGNHHMAAVCQDTASANKTAIQDLLTPKELLLHV